VRDEPKNPTGEWCAPWIQLAAVKQGTPGAQDASAAMQAWVPWNGYGSLLGARGLTDGARALTLARRAHVLSPLDTYVGSVLVDKLLAAGASEEARAVAVGVAAGGQPVHRVASELFLLRVEASEARFQEALARADRAMLPLAEDTGWVRAERLEIAWRGLEIAAVLDRAPEVADRIVATFLDPDPPPLDGAHLDAPLRLPAVCARASKTTSRRCFARLRGILPRLSGGILPGTEAFVSGAEAWARGDFAAAARAFRELVRDPTTYLAVLPEAMIEAFDRTGAPEVVAALEAAAPDRRRELGGASPAMVRRALRAARAGRREEARALAEEVIVAWAKADVAVPAVAQMRRLR
jgi:hypothetical protein